MRPLDPFETYLVHEFVDDYQDGLMSRRDMIRRVLHITGGVAATATVLTALGVTPVSRAVAAQEATTPAANPPRSPLSVPADDPRLIAGEITFPGDGGTVMAYQARPSAIATPAAGAAGTPVAGDSFPVVLICHENRGLTDHIRDVARRYAVEGYLACAVDLLSDAGGTAAVADPSEIPALLTRETTPEAHLAKFAAAIAHYQNEPTADLGRLAMTGYCFGGGITWRAATTIGELKAAAPYYGPPPPLDQVPNIKAAVLGVYSDDPGDFANEGRDELNAALDAAGIVHEFKIYPNTQHAFHNDTSQRYNEEAALAAWRDTVDWFATHAR